MSEREWQPGDVAMAVRVNGGGEFLVVRTRGGSDGDYWAAPNGWPAGVSSYDIDDYRPLAVIDPDDREEVGPLADAVITEASGHRIDKAILVVGLTKGLADLANPKPDEPTGLGAVVEDAEHRKWVRHDNTPGSFPWVRPGHGVAGWPEIDAVRVLSEGVQP